MTARFLPLLLVAVVVGCQKPTSKPVASGPAAAVTTNEPAADDPPGMNRWTDAQIEQTVREDLKLSALTLKKESRERYTGTGTDMNGKALRIVVRYRPGEYRIDAEGDQPGGSDKRSSHWAAEGVTPKWKEK